MGHESAQFSVRRPTVRARLRARRGAVPGVVAGTVFASGLAAQDFPQAAPMTEMGTVDIAADRTSYAPGESAGLAARLVIEDGWHTNSNRPTYDNLIATSATFSVPSGWAEPDAPAYPPGDMKSFGFTDGTEISVYEGTVFFRTSVQIPADAEAGTYPVRTEVTYQACDDSICLAPVTTEQTIGLVVGSTGAATNAEFFAAAGGQGSGAGRATTGGGFWWFIVLGFLGGLILNIMPCVLPILSLKVFGLVKSAGGGRGALVSGGLATALGIVLSFLLLATAAVVARSAGVAVGWGIQFQEPAFVGGLAVVMVLFTLNLWGLFEIPLPGALARVGTAGPTEGVAGHLTTGFFATLMATPCSAPFLGTALGFALTQNAATTFAMFGAIGFGMASPYLLLAAFPGLGSALPKPGAWMETFRGVMGFCMAAAVVWLLFVLSGQVAATRVAFFQLALLAMALMVWVSGRARAGTPGRRLTGAVAGALAVLSVAAVTRGADAAPTAIGVAPEDRLIAWQPFDRAAAEAAAAEGRYVFVDVTADWCLTCKVNEGLFIETEEVARAFEANDVIAMRADWTRRDEAIGRFLADFGRYGIPFYVMYRPNDEPYVFSELLSKAAILRLFEDPGAAIE
ncbi:MAG: thioredoxin family protein [Gemmatimonadetes bacterium]|nr:thioredoxin family protein [Gemmatimonadota bacterium]